MVLCVVVVLAGCGPKPPPAKPKPVDLTGGGAFKVIELSSGAAYLVDDKTRACFLVLPGRVGTGPVDCQRLKREVKEASSFVTWQKEESSLGPPFPISAAVADMPGQNLRRPVPQLSLIHI